MSERDDAAPERRDPPDRLPSDRAPDLLVATGVVTPGWGVASGRSGDPRFPGGTLRMQAPAFAARGLDLSAFWLGTLNVDVAPLRLEPGRALHTFHDVRWHPTEPPEHFSFHRARLVRLDRPGRGGDPADGAGGGVREGGAEAPGVEALVYRPHPETKPGHVQPDSVVEVLAPRLEGLTYGARVELRLEPGAGRFVPAERAASGGAASEGAASPGGEPRGGR